MGSENQSFNCNSGFDMKGIEEAKENCKNELLEKKIMCVELVISLVEE